MQEGIDQSMLKYFKNPPKQTESTTSQVVGGIGEGFKQFAQNPGGGIFSKMWEQTKERAGSAYESFKDVASGEINPVHGAFQVVGQGAGMIGDLIADGITQGAKTGWEALKLASPETAEKLKATGGAALEHIMNMPVAVGDGKVMQAKDAAKMMSDMYSAWEKNHPQLAKDLGAVLNIATLPVAGEGAAAGKAVLKKGIGAVGDITTGLAKGTGDVIEGIAREAETGAKSLAKAELPEVIGAKLGGLKQKVSNIGENLKEYAAEQKGLASLPEAERVAIQSSIPKEVVERISTSTPETKQALAEMFDGVEKRIAGGRDEAGNVIKFQPKEVPGQKLVDTAGRIVEKMRETGAKLGATKKALRGKYFEATPVKDKLFADFADLGVEIGEGGKLEIPKGVTVDPDELEVLSKVYDVVGGAKKVEAINGDRLRKGLFVNTNTAKQPLSDNAMRLARNYREMLTDSISTVDKNYGALAKEYAQNHGVLEDFTKLLGYKGNIEDLSTKGLKAGEVAMRVLGNAADRPQSVIDSLLAEANRLGIGGKENVDDLINLADKIEELFGSTQTRSLQGGVERGVSGALKKVPFVGQALEGVENLGAASEKTKLKAMRDLIKKSGSSSPKAR